MSVTGTPEAPSRAGISVADLKLSAPLRDAKPTKTVAAFVRTTGQGALEVDAKAKGGDLTKSRTQSSAAKNRVEAIQSTVAAVRSAGDFAPGRPLTWAMAIGLPAAIIGLAALHLRMTVRVRTSS